MKNSVHGRGLRAPILGPNLEKAPLCIFWSRTCLKWAFFDRLTTAAESGQIPNTYSFRIHYLLLAAERYLEAITPIWSDEPLMIWGRLPPGKAYLEMPAPGLPLHRRWPELSDRYDGRHDHFQLRAVSGTGWNLFWELEWSFPRARTGRMMLLLS